MKTYRMIFVAVLLSLTAPLFATHYPDSIQEVSKSQYRIRQGLNLDITGGVGFGRYAFKQFNAQAPHVSNSLRFPIWNAALGVNYYFLDWLGVGSGVQFSTYTNLSRVSQPWAYEATDSYGDAYRFVASPANIDEQQTMYMVEVPLALRFRVIETNVGFHAAAGMKFGIPIKGTYHLASSDAAIRNEVSYPSLGLTLKDNLPGILEDAAITSPSEPSSIGLKTLNYGAYAEVGMLIRMHQRIDLLLALAATYYVNDVRAEKSTTPLGFKSDVRVYEYDLPYAKADYAGVLHTDEVESLHPWSVMLILGLSINTGRTTAQHAYDDPAWGEREAAREARRAARRGAKTAANPEPESEQEPVAESAPVVEPEQVSESEQPVAPPEPAPIVEPEPEPMVEPAPIVEPEPEPAPAPIVAEPVKPADKPLHDLTLDRRVEIIPVGGQTLQPQVIRFTLNEFNPAAEAMEQIKQVAEALVRHPEQKVQINGHTCIIGDAEYNKRLSLRRAREVAKRLRELGVRDEQLIIQSFGSDVPFAD